jgi:hypothetical protein
MTTATAINLFDRAALALVAAMPLAAILFVAPSFA